MPASNTLAAVQASEEDTSWSEMSKVYLSAIGSCLIQKKVFTGGALGGVGVYGSHVENEYILREDALSGDWFRSVYPQLIHGIWIERWYGENGGGTEGLWDVNDHDGKIYCGENENAFLKAALAFWEIAPIDLLCDEDKAGLFTPGESGVACNDASVKSYYPRDFGDGNYDLVSHLKQRIAQLLGYTVTPPAALTIDTKLTNAELYWYYYNNFRAGCATRDTGGSPILQGTDTKANSNKPPAGWNTFPSQQFVSIGSQKYEWREYRV
jgi:hypothetical protein